jgi:hypothetical protein
MEQIKGDLKGVYKMTREVVSIKLDGTDVISSFDVDEVQNLTQIIAELDIIRFALLSEYFKRGKNE